MAQGSIEVTGREAVDPIEAIEFCYRQGWTDGLPVVPPTEERVADIMVVAAGGEEGAMSAVIPSWGPKVSSPSVTWSISWPSHRQ